ncbi:MAG TPA: hypothetical protein VG095_05150, partial [Chthoniobacterales bacterium]|nr:hypothetical protein [Chthoniobacterales bacterium]
TYEYTFMEDGTFHGSVGRKGQVVWAFSGKWSLDGDTINYEFSKSSLERVPDGTTDRDKLVEITKDAYVIEARDGKRRTYSRVKE